MLTTMQCQAYLDEYAPLVVQYALTCWCRRLTRHCMQGCPHVLVREHCGH